LEVIVLAWVAIAAVPAVIESISKIISNINELSKKAFPPKDKLKDENSKLSDALGKLKDSVQKIGITIRDYEEIYTAAIQEETTAKALTYTISVWKDGRQGENDPSIPNGLKGLKNLDLVLRNALQSNKEEIDPEDRDKINSMRSDIQDIFNSAEKHLSANTEDSWNEACDDIDKIHKKLGEISSLLNARFKAMSTTLIQASLKTKT
jgi:ElaB/YqjD/DUF883 family membrane-anchored ribosome-binding protein